MQDPIDTGLISVRRPTHVRHMVLAALCLITVINYMQRNSIGGAETRIVEDLHISGTDSGDAISDFFLAYSLCQIPSGWLAQRWGGRRALTLFAIGWSIMAGLTALAPDLSILRLARFGLGVFQAGIFPCSTLILASWYPLARRGFATAMLNSFMLIGGGIVSVVTGLLIDPLGWRTLFLFYAAPGLLWAGWFALWFRDRPRDHAAVNEEERRLLENDSADSKPAAGGSSAAVPWRLIFLSSPLWLICIQQSCRAGALRFFDMMLPTYLQNVRHQDIGDANLWTSLTLVAGVFGGLTGGSLSDWVLRSTSSRRLARQGVSIAGVAAGLGCYVLAYFTSNLAAAVLMASLGVFVVSFASPCSYALTMDMGGRNLGVVFGVMNMGGNLGSWAFTKFLPRVVEWRGWDAGLLVFAALHVVAIVCLLLINPNGTIGEPAAAQPPSKE